MQELPSEYRRPGKVDLAQIQAEAANASSDVEVRPTPLPDMEILDWDEGQAFLIQVSQKPYLQNLMVDVWLEDLEEATMAHIRLEVKAGCLLDLPVRVLYWLFKGRINQRILQALAGLRYELETGKPLERDAEVKLSLERMQIVRCE